jgi:hypothetical protein
VSGGDDWNFTLGSFDICGEAKVIVEPDMRKSMLFTLHIRDQFDWVKAGYEGWNRLHTVGLAKVFPVKGEYSRTVEW